MSLAATVSPDEIRERLAKLEHLRALKVAQATGGRVWEPRPHQIPPEMPWYLWLMLGGRGSGKTDGCASYFDRFMSRNSGFRGGIIAPTLGDAAEACVYGVSGLMAHNPTLRVRSRAGGTYVIWPNGSEAKLFGAHTMSDVDRLRAGGNRHIFWGEEVAAWRYLQEAVENMELGLRLGEYPHWIASTTPKTRPALKKLMTAHDTVLIRASIHDNPFLPDVQRQRLLNRYAGTRLEAQELLGQYIEDVEGALWTFETLVETRVPNDEDGNPILPDMVRVVVAVDPSGGDSDGNDEQGIVIVGKGVDGHGYVIGDRSCKLSPDGWGRRAVQAFVDFKADRIVGETNFGGDMVLSNVKVAAEKMGVEIATKKITASRGKVTRAEPISALYEQERCHNVDGLDELENQQRFWTPDSGWSPDRLDAMVWGMTELMLGNDGPIEMRSFVPRGRITTGATRFGAVGGL